MHIENPAGYLDQLLRQTRAHHVQLSTMADLKANMLLTAASLVLTFTIGYLTEPSFQWAAITLILFCLLTILSAIYATMPRLLPQSRRGTAPDTKRPGFNILFFGSFADMTYEDYCKAMEETLNDPDLAHEAMVRDVYTLGLFLARHKYRYLRIAYLVFLSGLVASTGVFAATQLLTMAGFKLWHLGAVL